MKKVTYLAVMEPVGNGAYSVYFPDLPGCCSGGGTLEEAERMAEEALGLHLYGMEKDGDEIPAPSASLQLDSDAEPGSLVCPVSVYPALVRNEMDNRRVKTNITIPAWLKELAEEKQVNYSRLLEIALYEYLGISSRP